MTRTGNFDNSRSASTQASATAGGAVTLNPSAMSVEQLSRMLGVAAEVVRRHITDGAPADFAGRMSLVQYAAWLNRRLTETQAERDREESGHGD